MSNATFVTLTQLKYLNLMGNSLRHVIEARIFFAYNLNLVNLSLDNTNGVANQMSALSSSSSSSGIMNKQLVQMRRRKLTSNGLIVGGDNKSSSSSMAVVAQMSPDQYVQHVRQLLLLNAKYTEKFVDCIIGIFFISLSLSLICDFI